MTEIEIDGQTYRFGKLDARRQWHVVRRVAPALAGVVSLVGAAQDDDGAILSKIEPFLAALGRMTDEDTDYVLDACLSVVHRKVDGDRGWASVGLSTALMFDDIGLATMMKIAFESGRENLGGFFAELRSMFPGAGIQEA